LLKSPSKNSILPRGDASEDITHDDPIAARHLDRHEREGSNETREMKIEDKTTSQIYQTKVTSRESNRDI
jgi:hypothetical protein